jgi:hypothetical protein
MNKLWQLKNLSSGVALNEPQLLPENWGPIFGMSGFLDKIGDLTWTGDPNLAGCGWVEVGDAPAATVTSTPAQLEWDRAKQLLAESDWAVLSDVPMSSGDRALWIEYRRALREIRLQPGFPDNIEWPKAPD